ncbi:hypothetical protein COCSADRAFT_208743 [Bipolaris sorokiniana ND90Pr]|uniref:Secreted protein n=1 Tax=Cochliobolus sativus (strain ND90Pr / ATCC 201652) TaxID=665912 RepID=M2SQ03_COCSN|nr:uncharacterized protein COCSADRAFT_208743 [Bipolaris sorokiniana ND90Pr]EMD69318.1 hypothetical protein COCSADRAFT_208743 [Bipolaris sorokiniana ND90Pr]
MWIQRIHFLAAWTVAAGLPNAVWIYGECEIFSKHAGTLWSATNLVSTMPWKNTLRLSSIKQYLCVLFTSPVGGCGAQYRRLVACDRARADNKQT